MKHQFPDDQFRMRMKAIAPLGATFPFTNRNPRNKLPTAKACRLEGVWFPGLTFAALTSSCIKRLHDPSFPLFSLNLCVYIIFMCPCSSMESRYIRQTRPLSTPGFLSPNECVEIRDESIPLISSPLPSGLLCCDRRFRYACVQ